MDWRFYATMTGLFLMLDLIVFFARRRDEKERRARWTAEDASNQKRHDEFMEALAEERRERMRNT